MKSAGTRRTSRSRERSSVCWGLIFPPLPLVGLFPFLYGALVGVMLVVWVTVNGWIGVGSPPDLTSSRIGNGRLVLMPVGGWASLLLCVGLVLYLLGLFAPLRQRRG